MKKVYEEATLADKNVIKTTAAVKAISTAKKYRKTVAKMAKFASKVAQLDIYVYMRMYTHTHIQVQMYIPISALFPKKKFV